MALKYDLGIKFCSSTSDMLYLPKALPTISRRVDGPKKLWKYDLLNIRDGRQETV